MIIEKAYAKVNLGLKVVNKREDGYHNLDMIMISIDHYDELTFEKDDQLNVISDNYICELKDNLIYKVARLIKKKYGISSGARITIQKNIMAGGGLGGGSSDAAATIRGLNKLWNLNLSTNEMICLGNQVGSDVAFCIEGKPSLVQGRGDIVLPLEVKIDITVILVCPDYSMSTKEVFSRYTPKADEKEKINELIKALKENNNKNIALSVFNDLESTVNNITLEKELVSNLEIVKSLINCGAINAVMTGSGSTIVGIAKNENNGNEIINKLRTIYPNYNLICCKNR